MNSVNPKWDLQAALFLMQPGESFFIFGINHNALMDRINREADVVGVEVITRKARDGGLSGVRVWVKS